MHVVGLVAKVDTELQQPRASYAWAADAASSVVVPWLLLTSQQQQRYRI